MEKDSLLNLSFLLIFCLVMGGFFLLHDLGDEPTFTAPSFVPAPVAPAAPDWIDHMIVGKSMEPWIPDGSVLHVYPADVPVLGDVVVWNCLTTKCVSEDGTTSFLKFIRRIDSRGCFWFEGRLDEYSYKGQRMHSFDATEYGYLCPGDFKVLGVVRDLPE
jgi:hypothetical protein